MSKYIGATAVNLSTTSADVTGNADIGGNLTVEGNFIVQGTTTTIDSANAQTVDLGDNDKIRLGDGDDLQIFHDGSNSFISDIGTGNLVIRGATEVTIEDSTSTRYLGRFIDGGSSTLYYNGSPKIATSSTGVTVTGSIAVDNGEGITTVGGLKYIADSDNNAPSSGAIHNFFTDNGTTSALAIQKDGKVGIGTTSPSSKLEVVGTGFTDSTIRLQRTDSGQNNDAGFQFTANAGANSGHGMGGIWFKNSLDSNAYALIRARTDDATGTSGRLDFITSTSAVNNASAPSMRIDSAGRVGIGTASPTQILSIEDSGNSPTVYVDGNSSPAFFEGRANRTSAGQHLTEFIGKWNNTRVARVVLTAGADTTNKDDGEIFFATASAGSMAERWRITRDGHFKAATNGLGIDFSASEGSSASSSILDNYEEGTRVPFLGRWTGGAISATYSSHGRYTVIGRMVTVSFDINVSSISSQGSSIAYIGGAPYNNDASQNYYFAGTFGIRTAIPSATIASSCIKHSTNNAIIVRQHSDFRENVDDNWTTGIMRGSITYEIG